jgi:hypothetical protein
MWRDGEGKQAVGDNRSLPTQRPFFKGGPRNQPCRGEPVPKADLPDQGTIQGTMEVRSSEDTVTFSDGA